MNEDKLELQDWQKEILKMEKMDNPYHQFKIKESNFLTVEQLGCLSQIQHWLEVINQADTMKEIRLGSMRYGKKGDIIYTIKFLIDEINTILSNGYYDENSKDWLNGLYKWHKDNHQNLQKAYM